ncbi:unnamed protein product [Protopolystoma xenopodis]|uniref:Uncharacterized protein n=1 Tax=Protopolystoma xenopodis TaxID=117903 RepID=A0A3S5BQJ2_9PLAT|nr:unnamed protein product [Protopolystoma xenopodis]
MPLNKRKTGHSCTHHSTVCWHRTKLSGQGYNDLALQVNALPVSQFRRELTLQENLFLHRPHRLHASSPTNLAASFALYFSSQPAQKQLMASGGLQANWSIWLLASVIRLLMSHGCTSSGWPSYISNSTPSKEEHLSRLRSLSDRGNVHWLHDGSVRKELSHLDVTTFSSTCTRNGIANRVERIAQRNQGCQTTRVLLHFQSNTLLICEMSRSGSKSGQAGQPRWSSHTFS